MSTLRADKIVTPGGLVIAPAEFVLATGTVSAAASAIEIDLPSGYLLHRLQFHDLQVSANGTHMTFRTSSDGGSTFDSGASDYVSGVQLEDWDADFSGTSQAGTQHDMTGLAVSDADFPGPGNDGVYEGIHGELWIFDADASDRFTQFYGNLLYYEGNVVNGNDLVRSEFGGRRSEAAVVDAIQLRFTGGNVDAGSWRLLGMKEIT